MKRRGNFLMIYLIKKTNKKNLRVKKKIPFNRMMEKTILN